MLAPTPDPKNNHDNQPKQALATVAQAAEERAARRALVLAVARGLPPDAKAAFFEGVRFWGRA